MTYHLHGFTDSQGGSLSCGILRHIDDSFKDCDLGCRDPIQFLIFDLKISCADSHGGGFCFDEKNVF